MPSITVVTTFHPAGYTKYGKRFLESFAARVDKRIKLLVYAEDCKPDNPDPSRIEILDAKQALPKLMAFKKRWKDVPKANGIPPDDIKRRRPKDWHKDFKWNAIRFANKVYAVFDAAQRCNTDWIVWLDADTYVHSPITQEQFEKFTPDNA